MSAPLLRYRTWTGRFRGPLAAVWPIARTAVARLFGRKMFWWLYAVGLLLFCMFFFGGFLLEWVEGQLTANPIRVGRFETDPQRMARFFRQGLRILNGSQDTFAYFFVYQGGMLMILLALAGAVLVGEDFSDRSLGFYLAKPIGRRHFLAGKCLAVGIVVNMVTTLPALGLYAQHAFGDFRYLTDADYFVATGYGNGPAGWKLLAGILGFGLIQTVFLSVLLVAVAGWVRRTVPLLMIWTALFMFLRLVAGVLVDGLKYDAHWRLLDLWNSLCILGFWCLGFQEEGIWPSPQPRYWEAAVSLLGVCTLCLIWLMRRTRNVEIVR